MLLREMVIIIMDNLIIALTGPSGAGKTTLSDRLVLEDNFYVPTHTTTRKRRSDDSDNLYRYFSHESFRNEVLLNNFLFWSGDSDIIDKRYGNYYGLLKKDFYDASFHNRLIFYISYKDIETILSLKNAGLNIEIVNLLYRNLRESMVMRLIGNERNHTPEEIKNRIVCAEDYEMKFRKILDSHDVLKIYTDVYNEEETYNIVKTRKLK